MPTNMKPAVKPRNRPHSQYNPINREDESEVNEQTQMVNLRNNRRSLDCTLSDYKAGGSEHRTAGGAGNEPRTADSSTRTSNNINMTAGNAPRAAARQTKASDNNRSNRVSELDSPSRSPDPRNITGYLTRPWNTENRTTDNTQHRAVETTNLNNTRNDPGNIRRYQSGPWNSSEGRTMDSNPNAPFNASRARSRSRSLDNELNQSRTSVNDTAESVDRLHSRRNTDDSISNFELRRTSSVQAKKKFMLGSYVILFVGILLAVSGAVLTVLAFHNHFGHISIGQQWSLAGIVLMTIGICLLLTYTVTAAKNKYWAVQEDIRLENRGGNYSRNLEQSSAVYIPAPYSRESNSEPPGVGGADYYRLARKSPSIHSSAAASTSQFTETSSVDMDEEPRQSATPSHKRIKRPYNHRYDVAGHEVESDTQSEGSLHSPAERAQRAGHADVGYKRTLRPAPGAPPDSGGDKKLRQAPTAPESARSVPRVPPTRTAPETPKDQVTPTALEPSRKAPGVPTNSGKSKVKQGIHPGVPDLIRATPDSHKARQPEKKPGQGQGHCQSEVKLRPAPVLPEVARQARMSDKPVPPAKVHLPDPPPHTEVAMRLTVGMADGMDRDGQTRGQVGKKKGPLRPAPPKDGVPSQENVSAVVTETTNVRSQQKNMENSPRGRKPPRPAPEAPLKTSAGEQISGASSGTKGTENPAKPTPSVRPSKLSSNQQQQQQYCCIEGRQGASGQCSCAAGEGSGQVEGHEGPYTGGSDDELATNTSSHKPTPLKKPPPTMKKPTRSYEEPPEEGAPPCYDEITH